MTRPVRIVTDSTTDFSLDEAATLGVTIIPLLVRFGEETWEDRIALTPSQFYARLATTKVLPTTSQPPPAAFLDVYRRLLDEGADVLSLHISARLSGTYNAANIARDQLDPTRIATVDTRQATISAQVLAREAIRAVGQGKALSELVALMEELKPRARLVAMVNSLDHLRRGGRIGRVAALVGALLSVKVLITVADGEVVPLDKVRTRFRALERIEQLAAEGAPFQGDLVVGHTDDPDEAASLTSRLRSAYPNQPLHMSEVGPAIGSHAGPGAVGVAYIAGATH